MPQFIGKKKVKSVEETQDKTGGGISIMKVIYDDGSIEHLSKLMLDKVLSSKVCDETELRDKRIQPVVATVLTILREWGVKTGELQYLSSLLNSSLDYNSNQALLKLVSKWMPKPNSLDDVSLITIDRILKDDRKQN